MNQHRVPVGPFSDWLAKQADLCGGVEPLAARVGVDPRSVQRYIDKRDFSRGKWRPKRWVSLYMIDKYLVGMDSETGLWEFEPEESYVSR